MFGFICAALIIIIWRSFTPDKDFGPMPEPYPIIYPVEPMFPNYISIAQDIQKCSDEKSLNTVYVRILIFQGNYPDSAKFLSELVEAYNIKEGELKSHSC